MSSPAGQDPSGESGGRALLFLNEVAGGRKLLRTVRERQEAGGWEFYVVAPQNQPRVGHAIDEHGARDAARSRVDVTLSVLREFGIEARGMVMDPQPLSALDDAVRNVDPTEIVISCRPESRYGVLRRDLVSTARSRYEVPVEHISVQIEDDALSWDVTHTLVVASRTVASESLRSHLKEKASEAPHRYTIVSPRYGDTEEERIELCDRLARTLAELYRQDVAATGQPSSPDPFAAVETAIHYYSVDEVLISTFEGETSRWLQEGLVDRVKEITDKPVAHVVSGRDDREPVARAEPEAAAGATTSPGAEA